MPPPGMLSGGFVVTGEDRTGFRLAGALGFVFLPPLSVSSAVLLLQQPMMAGRAAG